MYAMEMLGDPISAMNELCVDNCSAHPTLIPWVRVMVSGYIM